MVRICGLVHPFAFLHPMTKEEHDILVKNNKLLRLILLRLCAEDKVTPEEFAANVLANLISNRIDGK